MSETKIALSLFSNRGYGYGRRQKRNFAQENLESSDGPIDSLPSFKETSFVREYGPEDRSIPQNCFHCSAPVDIINCELRKYGIRNCLNMSTLDNDSPFYAKWFPYLVNSWRLGEDIDKKYHLVTKEEVFEDEIFLEAMLRMRAKSDKPEDFVKIETEKLSKFLEDFYIKPVSGRVMRFLISFAGWFFARFFTCCFESISVHQGELRQLETFQRYKLPVIYIPVHKSVFDPFIINWVFHSSNYKCPLFMCSRETLRSPVIGKLSKMIGGLGCTQNTRNDYKSSLLSPCVNSYISQILLRGNHFMIPLEPNRSRCGKSSSSIIGAEFINIAYQLHMDKELENVTFVPISVSYEKLPEENIILEYEDGIKSKPSFGRKLKSFIISMWKGFGIARVNIGQPISLREVIKNSKRIHSQAKNTVYDVELKAIDGDDMNWEEDRCSITSTYQDIKSFRIKKSDGLFVDNIAFHSLYTAKQNGALMSTNFVAFLLLKKSPSGATLSQLITDFTELYRSIRFHKIDVGFKGEYKDVILRGAEMLGSNLIIKENVKGEIRLKPVLNNPQSLIKLNYYSSAVTNYFALEGILALVLTKLLGFNYRANKGMPNKYLNISELKVIRECQKLCNHLKGEFILHPPCITTENAILNALRSFKDQSLIRNLKKKVVTAGFEDDWANSDDACSVEDFESGEKLSFCHDPDIQVKLDYLAKLISPYIEMYSVMAQALCVLLPNEKAPSGYKLRSSSLRRIIFKEMQKYYEKYNRLGELLVIDTVKNFLNVLLEQEVLEHQEVDGKIYMNLKPMYREETSFRNIIYEFSSYRLI